MMERVASFNLAKKSLVQIIRYSLEVIQMFLYFMLTNHLVRYKECRLDVIVLEIIPGGTKKKF